MVHVSSVMVLTIPKTSYSIVMINSIVYLISVYSFVGISTLCLTIKETIKLEEKQNEDFLSDGFVIHEVFQALAIKENELKVLSNPTKGDRPETKEADRKVETTQPPNAMPV